MSKVVSETVHGCAACRSTNGLGLELSMAFQPLVDVESRRVWAYEALVRGADGRAAAEVLKLVNDENRYAFDQNCRVKAIELASKLGVAERGAKLSVNFMPGAVYSPAACIRRTLDAARQYSFPLQAIIFEITENERLLDVSHMLRIIAEYNRYGFTMALDDFGAGFSGLNMLSQLEGIRLLKLDGVLIRGIDTNSRAERIVASMFGLCASLGIQVLAECVETVGEYLALRRLGISLMQGYLFARPGFEMLPEVTWPEAISGETASPFPTMAMADRQEVSLQPR